MNFIQELDYILPNYYIANSDSSATTSLLTSFTGTMTQPSITMYSFISQ